jgi:hypothetical protein
MWRKRVQEEKTKHEKLNFAEGRFKCSMQRQTTTKFLKDRYTD